MASQLRDGANLSSHARAIPITFNEPSGLFSLGGMLGAAASRGAAAYNAYDTASRAQSFIAKVLSGASLHNALTNLVIEAAADRAGGKLLDFATDAFKKGKNAYCDWRRKGFCNCFVAGTQISTPNGTQPIESVEVGDLVLTKNHLFPSGGPRLGHVTRVFETVAPIVAWLELSNGRRLGTTLGHEVWVERLGWASVAELETRDGFIDGNGGWVDVDLIEVEYTERNVFNLEVDGAFTYFANGIWVHNFSRKRGGDCDTSLGGSLRAEKLSEVAKNTGSTGQRAGLEP